jgi:16S rRNA (adenine1518-N6/adenine1519-N6)-dimethyltransferase
VVEVGPGGGVLTGELLAAGARAWGVELDLEWAAALRSRLQRRGATSSRAVATSTTAAPLAPSLQPVVMDALAFPWERLPAPTLVCGNLPYNVATPILAAVLPHHGRIPRAAFLLQKEVAERLTARPGTRDYGALTVFTACHAEATILGRIKPGAFRPPPRVDSAFVGLALRPPPLPEPELAGFLALVRHGFAQKRKTLANSLAAAGPHGAAIAKPVVEEALATLGHPPTRRAEELALAEWLTLWRALAAKML